MDIATLVGIVLGFASLIVAFLMEGGHAESLLGITAAMIVFGGTIGATMTSYSLADILSIPKLIARSMKTPPDRRPELVEEIVKLAEMARRDGLLALEGHPIDDPFLKRAVMMVVDGTDPELTEQILHADVEAMAARHARAYGMFTTMGGFAPTMGIIGTVMGLVHVLGSIDKPENLGPAIALAFIATLYGVASANIFWLPVAAKLQNLSKKELLLRNLMLEGIVSLQAGYNPILIRERLTAFLRPELREEEAAAGREEE